MADKYKKFTAQAKAGIKGEAFFESLISDYSLPHHVVGPKDLGIDYICEWVHDDKPTGILYAVQVKTFRSREVRPKYLCDDTRNKLQAYKIRHSLLKTKNETKEYWRGFGIPIYLFVILYSGSATEGSGFECYYRRFTEVLTIPNITDEQVEQQNVYYKVYSEGAFLAFADQVAKKHGFARDLFVDVMRCTYSKGLISWMTPKTLGLGEFPEEESVFSPLFRDYSHQILRSTTKQGIFWKTWASAVSTKPRVLRRWRYLLPRHLHHLHHRHPHRHRHRRLRMSPRSLSE